MKIMLKISCDKHEHCRMVNFVHDIVKQYRVAKMSYTLESIVTTLTWGFRDRGINGYRLQVDKERQQINIEKGGLRKVSMKVDNKMSV